jgi:hypothetical protein
MFGTRILDEAEDVVPTTRKSVAERPLISDRAPRSERIAQTPNEAAQSGACSSFIADRCM